MEKSVSKNTVWHHEACRVMINGDPEGQFFISHSHTNNGFFVLLTIKYLILYLRNVSRSFRVLRDAT